MAEGSGASTTPNQADDISRELRYYKNFLEQLIHFIRHADRADVSQLISIIRSDAPNERILSAMFEATIEHANKEGITEGQVQHT
jgi:ubiquinone/menaquinone biosynthesis C-methylase UbiE